MPQRQICFAKNIYTRYWIKKEQKSLHAGSTKRWNLLNERARVIDDAVSFVKLLSPNWFRLERCLITTDASNCGDDCEIESKKGEMNRKEIETEQATVCRRRLNTF